MVDKCCVRSCGNDDTSRYRHNLGAVALHISEHHVVHLISKIINRMTHSSLPLVSLGLVVCRWTIENNNEHLREKSQNVMVRITLGSDIGSNTVPTLRKAVWAGILGARSEVSFLRPHFDPEPEADF